jgi:hypothetical protein
MNSRVTHRQVQTAAQGSVCQTTLQTVVKPAEDDLAVAIVVHWLCSGRITFLGT